MKTARQRRSAAAVVLLEDVQRRLEFRALPDGTKRVDPDAGVIRGVKVLGLRSENGRVYLAEAIRAAVPLYEGISVRINHRKRDSKDDQPVQDVFGWLKDVRADDAGELWADLHFLKTHPMAAQVCEAAERNPELFGLSHNADGRIEKSSDGLLVVLEITEVKSVDLVADPATVAGLFEGRRARPVTIKLKKLWEGAEAKFDAAKRARVRKLFEAMDDYADHEVDASEDEDPEKMSANEHLWHGVKEAAKAVIEDEDLSADDKHQQIKALLKGHENMVKGAAVGKDEDSVDEDEEEPEVEAAEDGDGDEKKTEESKKLRRRLNELESKDAVRELCESLNFSPTKTQFQTLLALKGEQRKAQAKEFAKGAGRRGVRTQGIEESRQTGGDGLADLDTRRIKSGGEEFAQFLRRGGFGGRED